MSTKGVKHSGAPLHSLIIPAGTVPQVGAFRLFQWLSFFVMFTENYLDSVPEVASSGSKWRIVVPSSWQLFSFGAEELDEVD